MDDSFLSVLLASPKAPDRERLLASSALAAMVRHAPHRGMALRGVLEALVRLPTTLMQRRRIQRARTVDLNQLRTVMAPEGLEIGS